MDSVIALTQPCVFRDRSVRIDSPAQHFALVYGDDKQQFKRSTRRVFRRALCVGEFGTDTRTLSEQDHIQVLVLQLEVGTHLVMPIFISTHFDEPDETTDGELIQHLIEMHRRMGMDQVVRLEFERHLQSVLGSTWTRRADEVCQ